MPELTAPVDPGLAEQLDGLARGLRTSEHRRSHPSVAHARGPGGHAWCELPWSGPAGRRTTSPDGDALGPAELDLAGRREVAGRLLDQVAGDGGAGQAPLLWLTAPVGEAPAAAGGWTAAVLAAAHERGLDPTWVVVTRRGWLDPRSGVGGRPRRAR